MTTSVTVPHGRSVGALALLDVLRGLAALYVMLGHTRFLLWTGYHNYLLQGHLSILQRAAATVSPLLSFGHEAVMVFFVISGFCIHLRAARELASPDTGPPKLRLVNFAIRRLRRLYPPLVLALLLTLGLDHLGMRVYPDLYAGHTAYATINENLKGLQYGPIVFLGNLFGQATFTVPFFGSNGPLWSLSYEFWFYVLYPVYWNAASRLRPALTWLAVITLSLIAGVGTHVSNSWVLDVVYYWSIWCTGALLAEVFVGRIQLPSPVRSLTIVGAALLPAVLVRRDFAVDLAVGVLTAYLVGRLISSKGAGAIRVIDVLRRRLSWLGDMSYTLYLVHFPLLAFLSAWWLSSHRTLPAGGELAILGAGGALLFGYGAYWCVERQFSRRRHFVLEDQTVRFQPGAAIQSVETRLTSQSEKLF